MPWFLLIYNFYKKKKCFLDNVLTFLFEINININWKVYFTGLGISSCEGLFINETVSLIPCLVK